MHLSPDLHKRLSDELRFATGHMAEADSPQEKLYYFSVFFGETVRVLNWQWDEDIALIWAITQHVHQAISNRMQLHSQGVGVITVPREVFDALTRESIALVDWIDKKGEKSELCEIVAAFSEIIYATTGNGFYLLRKGHFTLER
jgi:hypothetical protein